MSENEKYLKNYTSVFIKINDENLQHCLEVKNKNIPREWTKRILFMSAGEIKQNQISFSEFYKQCCKSSSFNLMNLNVLFLRSVLFSNKYRWKL